MCICSRVALLKNINELSIEEVLLVLSRMGRLYVFLALLSIFNIYAAIKDSKPWSMVYECVMLVIFVAYWYILRLATKGIPNKTSDSEGGHTEPPSEGDLDHTERLPKLKVAVMIVCWLIVMYTVKMVFNFLSSGSFADLALSIFSILIQFSTLFVLFKLCNKIEETNGLLASPESISSICLSDQSTV